jgi:replicative DNA helicase
MNDIPPHSSDAERALIGSVLFLNQAMDEIDTAPTEFYEYCNEVVFATCRDMWNQSRTMDAVTVAEELQRRGLLSDAGGAQHILELLECVPHAAHVKHYARIVRDRWLQRQLIVICKEHLSTAYGATDGVELGNDLLKRVSAILDSNAVGGTISLAEAIESYEELEDSPQRVLKTGITDLDRQLKGGLRPAQLVIGASRPSCGKSVLGAQVCRNIAERNIGVLLISLEMQATEIAGRFVNYERSKNEPAIESLKNLPMQISDSIFNVDRVTSLIRKSVHSDDLQMVVIDYLQLMEPADRTDARERQVAAMTRRLKLLAAELQIPVLVLCQLNRQCDIEKRMPRLSDLRESGAIEQDADIVLLLHRPDMTDPEDQPGKLLIHVAKHRGGPTGVVTTVFRKEVQRIEDAAIYEGAL